MRRIITIAFSFSFIIILSSILMKMNRCSERSYNAEIDTVFENLFLSNNEVEIGFNADSVLSRIALKRPEKDSLLISFNNGCISMVFLNIEKNIDPIISIPASHKASGVCPYRCYSLLFDEKGHLKAVGGLLYGQEGPDSDFSFEYGKWQYFDVDGHLCRVKVFE